MNHKNGSQRLTVLLVDDEHCVTRVGERALRAAGFDVLIAHNGRQALELFQSHRVDISLVILDLSMPEMSGAETFEHLKRLDCDVRVLVSSGFGPEDARDRLLTLAPYGFIQKPYRLAALLDAVRTAVQNSNH